MVIHPDWIGPENLSANTSYTQLEGYCGLYCIAISDYYYIQYPLGKSRIVYFGSGNLYERISAHSKSDSWGGNLQVQELLNNGHFLEFSYLPVDNVSNEELRSLERGLIEEFGRSFGSMPIGNKQIPFHIEWTILPEKYFRIIVKYTY